MDAAPTASAPVASQGVAATGPAATESQQPTPSPAPPPGGQAPSASPTPTPTTPRQAPPATAPLPPGTFGSFTASNGLTLRYHLFDHGRASSQLVGTVAYFDGDGTSSFETPGGGRAATLAGAAASGDRALLFVDAPSGSSWRSGNPASAAVAVPELVQQASAGTAGGSTLLAGYSGGAEFLSRHLLRTGTGWLPAGSGAVFIGGGGIYGEQVSTPAGGAGPRLTWVVGDEDGYGATDPADWSALEASAGGFAAYQSAGYADASRDIVSGDHVRYDFAAIVRTSAAALGR